MQLRIGNGYDIHRLAPGRPLILGGVCLEHPDSLGWRATATPMCSCTP